MTTVTTHHERHRIPMAALAAVALAMVLLVVVALVVANDGSSSSPAPRATSAEAGRSIAPTGSVDISGRRALSSAAYQTDQYGSADALERSALSSTTPTDHDGSADALERRALASAGG
jgi:hypothetical protein